MPSWARAFARHGIDKPAQRWEGDCTQDRGLSRGGAQLTLVDIHLVYDLEPSEVPDHGEVP